MWPWTAPPQRHLRQVGGRDPFRGEQEDVLHPGGFAHGFLVLSDVAEFCYKCTDVYDPTSEGGIPYDDPTVNVQWPDCGCEHKTSAKDKLHEPFAAQKFEYFEKW